MKVREIMTSRAEVTDPDTTIQGAAQQMASVGAGFLPVCENDRIVGSVTDRDIVVRGLANGRDPAATSVGEAMTPGILYANQDDDIEDAAASMREGRVRRLPVLNSEKQIVGVISLGDLAVRSDEAKLTQQALEGVSQPV